MFVLLEIDPFRTAVKFLERARGLGLQPILFSTKPNFLGAELHHVRLFKITTTTVIEAVDRLGRDQVRGVWSLPNKFAELAAHVAMTIGRQAADPKAIKFCSDKLRTRQKLAEAGIRDVEFVLAHSAKEAVRAARALGGRVVVKPRSSTGSMGVRLCCSGREVQTHFNALAELVPNLERSGALIETAIDGQQFSVQIFDGRSIGVTHQTVGPPPAFITVKLDFPWLGDAQVERKIVERAELAVAAVGCIRGPASVDLRYDSEGPHILEINPRLAGDMIPENVLLATGIDLVEATVRFACGLPYNLSPSRKNGSATHWLLRPNCAVNDVLGCDEAANVPGVVEVRSFRNWYRREGPARDYRDRLAFVISKAETSAKAGEVASAALKHLHVKRLKQSRLKNLLQPLLQANFSVSFVKPMPGRKKNPSISYSIVSDEKAFDALGPEWQDLFERTTNQMPFSRYSWLRQCWKRQREDLASQLFIIVLRNNSRGVLMAPLVLRPSGSSWQVSFLDSLTPQYNDVLTEDANYVGLFWEYLTSIKDIRRFELKWLRDDSDLLPYVEKATGASKMHQYKAPLIDLSQFAGWDAYLRHLSRSLRQDHGRQLRNLEKRGRIEFRMAESGSYSGDMAWLFARKREWVDRKAKSPWIKSPATEQLFTAAAREGIGSGQTWLTTLSANGETIAATLSFRERSTLYLSKITYDPAWHVFSPARTLFLLTIRRAFEEGIVKCDLMTGRGAWKDSLSTGFTVVRNKIILLN